MVRLRNLSKPDDPTSSNHEHNGNNHKLVCFRTILVLRDGEIEGVEFKRKFVQFVDQYDGALNTFDHFKHKSDRPYRCNCIYD